MKVVFEMPRSVLWVCDSASEISTGDSGSGVKIRGCVDPPACWLETTRANTSSEVNDSRQVHSLHLKHPKTPLTPRLHSFFYCCRPLEKKEREALKRYQCSFASKAGPFCFRSIRSRISSSFLALPPLQHRLSRMVIFHATLSGPI